MVGSHTHTQMISYTLFSRLYIRYSSSSRDLYYTRSPSQTAHKCTKYRCTHTHKLLFLLSSSFFFSRSLSLSLPLYPYPSMHPRICLPPVLLLLLFLLLLLLLHDAHLISSATVNHIIYYQANKQKANHHSTSCLLYNIFYIISIKSRCIIISSHDMNCLLLLTPPMQGLVCVYIYRERERERCLLHITHANPTQKGYVWWSILYFF